MQKTLPIIFALFYALNVLSYGQAAEICFYQDSVMPNKIWVKLKLFTEPIYNGSMKDSAYIYWGDGNASFITRVDTVRITGINYTAYNSTFLGYHIYNFSDSALANGFVNIGYSDGQRLTGIANISDMEGFYIRALINFSYIKNMKGYHSPCFRASLYCSTSIDSTLIYNPQFISYNSLATKIQLQTPLSGNLYYVSIYFMPNVVSSTGADTIFTCDSTNGLLIWRYPSISGLDDIAYQIIQYSNDTLISIVMQDMLLFINDNPAGISNINNSSSRLKCYPSPTPGTFFIDMCGFDAGAKQISIYNQLGQVVYQMQSQQDKINLDSKLQAGVYTVMVTQNGQQINTRVVIQ